MFIISLHYCVPLSIIDKYIAEHKAFLEEHYANGNFILSGRKNPRTGGVIISTIQEREHLNIVLAQDPFHRASLAHYDIIEIEPTMCAKPLEYLIKSENEAK